MFRNCTCEANNNRPFGLGLTDINEVNKQIVYMIYDIIVFFGNCMNGATDNKSFGLGLAAINEVHEGMDGILDNIFVVFFR